MSHFVKKKEVPKKGDSFTLEKVITEYFNPILIPWIKENIENEDSSSWVHKLLSCIETLNVNNGMENIRGKHFVICGSYKCIFNIEGSACAFEMCTKAEKLRRDFVYETLDSINDCHLVSPVDWKSKQIFSESESFPEGLILLLTRMKYCVKGDLFTLFTNPDKKLIENKTHLLNLIKPLASTLIELHKEEMYIIDIKLENTLLCTCAGKDVFAFADLDDITFGDEKRSMIVTPGYSMQILGLVNIPGGSENKKAREWTDWNAFCNTILPIMSFLLYDKVFFLPLCAYELKENFISNYVLNEPTNVQLKKLYNKNKSYITPFMEKICTFLLNREGVNKKVKIPPGIWKDVDNSFPKNEKNRDASIKMLINALKPLSLKSLKF